MGTTNATPLETAGTSLLLRSHSFDLLVFPMHKILAAGGYYPVSICCMSSLSYGRFPYACCAPSSAAPVPVQGRPLLPFWQHGRLCPGRHSQHKVFTSYVSFCICFFQRGRQLHGFAATGLAQSFQVSIRSSISDVNRRSR